MDVFSGFTAVKTVMDIAKTLKNVDDQRRMNEAVIELQSSILSNQETISKLRAEKCELEKRIAELEQWDKEKQRYELLEVQTGVLVYRLRESEVGSEPQHEICPHCYQQGKKSVLQTELRPGARVLTCPNCKSDYYTAGYNSSGSSGRRK